MNLTKGIISLFVLLLIALFMLGCSTSTSVVEEEVLKVDGIPIAGLYYDIRLDQVKSNIVLMEEIDKDSGPSAGDATDDVNKRLLGVMKKYDPKLIAFATLVLDYAVYAEALKMDITISEEEIQELVEQARHAFSDMSQEIA